MRKRVPLTYDDARGWYVDLPTYAIEPGSFEPVTPGSISPDGVDFRADPVAVAALNPTVIVRLPADFPLDRNGKADAARLRAMYRHHPRFKRDDWTPPNVSGPLVS